MPTTHEQPAIVLDESERRILEALRGLRYGAVEIQVHDSRIVRITRTEKVRVDGIEPAKGR